MDINKHFIIIFLSSIFFSILYVTINIIKPKNVLLLKKYQNSKYIKKIAKQSHNLLSIQGIITIFIVLPMFLLFVIFLFLDNNDKHLYFTKYIDSNIIQPIIEYDYGIECGLDTFMDKILDPFVSKKEKNFLSAIIACFKISPYPQIISLLGRDFKKIMSEITKLGW